MNATINHLRRALLAALLATAGFAQAQAQAQAQSSTGRTYTPGPFDEVEIHGSAELRFNQGDTDQIVVEGGEEVQRELRLDLRNGRLYIQPSGGWKFWNSRRVLVTVTARDLKRLSISGAADVVADKPVKLNKLLVDISGAGLARFDKLQADELRFVVSGAGDGQFSGSVEQLTVSVSGKSDLRAEQLRAQRGRVAISGLSDAAVWVEKELSIAISGIGTVDYWGTPTVKRSTAGVATINARGAKP